jgi:hypothetical protein
VRKKSSKWLLSNKQGQFVVEAMLLMVLSIGLLYGGLKVMRDGNVLSNLISGPWEKVAGMIESGVWESADKAAAKHPNSKNRVLTGVPDS